MIDNRRLWELKRWEKINKKNYKRKERKRNFNSLLENNFLKINRLWEGPGRGLNKNSKAITHINQKFNKIKMLLKINYLISVTKILQKISIIKIKRISNNINQQQTLKTSRNHLNQNTNPLKILDQPSKAQELKITNQIKKLKRNTLQSEIKWKKTDKIL